MPYLEYAPENSYMRGSHTGRDEVLMKRKNAFELQEMRLAEPECIIDGIVPEGYTVLSAPRKIGKSWLAVQMCYAVASGGTVLGRQAVKGQAIYITLEETMQMSASRQRKTWGDRPAPQDMIYVFDCKTIENGFTEELDALIADEGLDNVRLVVVDVLAKIDGTIQKGEDVYHKDYRVGSALKEWTKDKHVGLVAITHVSKKKSDDPYDDTMGTGGVTGSADAIITIRKKGRTTATMSVIGRSLPETDIDMRLENCIWITDTPDYQISPIYDAVIKAADETEGEKISCTDLINAYDLDEQPKNIGEYLMRNIENFKNVGIGIEPVKNGSGSKSYRIRRV